MPRNQKGDREVTRNVLNYKNQKTLDAWVVENYTKLGLDDAATAIKAAEEVGFPVTDGNIKFMREQNDIQNNRARGGSSPSALEKRVETLEANQQVLSKNHEAFDAMLRDLEKSVAAFKLAMKFNK